MREMQRTVWNRWDRTKDGRARQTDTPGVSVSPSCSQWAVSDPPCLLYGYSPASDGISNSLINQELCYVTLPLPLTHRRENHHSFFFLQHKGFILLCASPTEPLILYIRLETEIWENLSSSWDQVSRKLTSALVIRASTRNRPLTHFGSQLVG